MIGENIRKRREELGLTQEQLAVKVDYKSKTTIAKIESGVNDITQSKIVQFANALNVSVAYLMGWDEKTKDNLSDTTQDEKQLLTSYRQLNREGQEVLLNQVKVMVISGVYKKHYSAEMGEEKAN